MRAGRLRHRVVVEEPVTTQNETGEEEVVFTAIGREWASVQPLRGREQLQAQQIDATLDTKIGMRWSPTVDRITPKWRLSHLGVVYNVVSVAHIDMARREVELMCSSGLNRG